MADGMRAWRFSEFGDIQHLKLGEFDIPEPQPGEVLVKLRVAALNPADRLLVEGLYPGPGDPPLTVGRDGAGTVVKAPNGSPFSEGDAVCLLRSEIGITRQGTLAEYVTVPERSLAPLPDGWTFEQGAAWPLVALTAWKALVVQGAYSAGETVLIDGASGGVGLAAVQLAKAQGARVVALSRDAAKRDELIAFGADYALDSDARGDAIQSALNGGGVDVVIENLGGPFVQRHLAAVNPRGRIMVIGLLAGRKAEIDMGLLLFKQARVEGVHVGQFAPDEAQAAWKRIVETMKNADVRPVIDRVFPMGEVQEAFDRLRGGHLGKVLVDVTA